MKRSNEKVQENGKSGEVVDKRNLRRKSKRTGSRGNCNRRGNTAGSAVDNTKSVGSNDPSWYTNNMALVNNAGTFSFNNAAGAPLYGAQPNGSDLVVPGVFEYVVQMIPGVSDNPYSPINIAARALYDRINYKNSRNFTYDAPDLMMYMYAASSAYAYWAWMVRVYGIMNTYSQINRYVPDTLVKATGVNPDSVRLNMAQFRYYINLYARKINVLALPTGMPLFNRYMWLFSNVYMDAENTKAGLYISRPYGFYKYIENTTTGGACVMTLIKDNMGIDDIIKYGNELAEAILSSQDMNNISTDVLKAFEGAVMSLPDLAAEYYVTPTYNQEVLEQLHNIKCFGDYIIGGTSADPQGVVTVTPSGNLIQDPKTGYLSFEMELADKALYSNIESTNIVLDSFRDNPTPEDVFVMSRFIAYTDKVTGNLKCAGSDIVLKFRVWKTHGPQKYMTTFNGVKDNMTMADAWLKATMYAEVSKFDYAPLVWELLVGADNNKPYSFRINGDVFNYTTIDQTSIYKLHEAAR